MKSSLPKVLHPVAGKPMIVHSLEAARTVSQVKPVLVVGVGAGQVRSTLGDQVNYAVQEEQLGTGHAVLQAQSLLAGKTDLVLVTYADMPLLKTETLRGLIQHHHEIHPTITILTVIKDNPRGFGRVVRDADNTVLAIVEEPDATPEQLEIRELNAGVYCFDANWLWAHLEDIPLSAKGEYYLTNLVKIAVAGGGRIQAMTSKDPDEVLGVNSRVHLAEVEAAFRRRINEKWMLNGITFVDPETAFIQADVTLGPDSVIFPNTFLEGNTSIGPACRIGPNTVIRDSTLGSRCIVFASVVEGSTLEDDVDVGPFGHLRKGAHLASGVHMGNYGEVKNAFLGPGTKMGHFSYVGDATIGRDVNIGAGTITCNYDGKRKHRTEIGEGAFIGSDVMLVAPLRVGERARIGAGSVVTRDIPAGSLAYGVPARVKDARPIEGQSDQSTEKE
jgi:bifunctional UDP-N-acetylglucosamine pyrophosphorylase/glucosamine-1-phosphate N-acetyltransferase